MSGRTGSLAAARYRLGRAGYVADFELIAGKLWCRSCDVALAPEGCRVDVSIVVGRSEGHVVRLAAIRSDSPALRGTWLVGTSADEGRFMEDLVRRGLERATARVQAQGAWLLGDVAGAPAGPEPQLPAKGHGARRAARVLTVTW